MGIDRLIEWVAPSVAPEFAPPLFDEAAGRATLAAAGRSADDHARVLHRWNGAYALRGSLHLFGARTEPPNQSLDAWNAPGGWRQGFGATLDGVTLFAETAFGDQFGYRDGKVVWFHAMEARVERMASGFSEWLECVFIEPGRYLSIELFDACVAAHGPLPYGGHFAPRTPWRGDALTAGTVEVVPSRDSMERKAAASMTGVRARVP